MATATAGMAAMQIPMWTFADRMRKIRRDVLDLDQHEIAARLGITKAAYAAWESGRNEPRSILTVARKIELMSGVPAAWILGVDLPGPGLDTDAVTHRYPSASSPARGALSLVRGGTASYRDVAARYGSSASTSGNDDDRFGPRTSGTVNHAHAA